MAVAIPESRYEFREVEKRWRALWEEQKAFRPEYALKAQRIGVSSAKSFCLVIPPPNITGELHVGHALNQTIQDVAVRTARKRGYNTLWLPGTDHAGIATQLRVENELKSQNIERLTLGREKFVKKIWEWKEKYGSLITEQQRLMGFSLDWSRERFTMDEGLSHAVRKVFVKLYEQGLVYRAKRMIHWDPASLTALSDLELTYDENFQGELYSFAYPLAEQKGEIVVATTRPETMLGDSAIAVHPEDGRYQSFIGSCVSHPFVKRKIKIIADAELVDPEFGTGAVKLTPAHDPNDFAAGQRHKLDMINIFDERAHINEEGARFAGLERYAARKAVKEELARLGLERGAQAHTMSVARSQRSGVIVEPMLSTQWFVKAVPLAKKAKQAVQSGTLKILPHQWENTYFRWMDEIRDWCISRQLWWGHRIPAWYGPDQKIFVAEDEKKAQLQAQRYYKKKVPLYQDPDVLDTWFSSALWPFSTLGWPKKTRDLLHYYPTALLVTGADILFFWVARMLMMGLHFMKKVPFRTVYLHGLMRDEKGQKMSKTKGNVIDPLQVIQEYGADAFRFFLMATLSEGKDSLYSEQRLKGYQNFANKIWNSSRFIVMNLPTDFKPLSQEKILKLELEAEDHWILSRLNQTNKEMSRVMADYKFHLAAELVYSFFWHEFCDWYIELSKARLFATSNPASARVASQILCFVLQNALGLLHPFMPFITEEIHSFFNFKDTKKNIPLLTASPWPKLLPLSAKAKRASRMFGLLQEMTYAVRLIRSEAGIAPDKKLKVILRSKNKELAKILSEKKIAIERLAKAKSIELRTDQNSQAPKSPSLAMKPFTAGEVYVSLEGVLDIEKEKEKLQKDLDKVRRLRKGAQAKLSNEKFLKKAPQPVLAKENAKLDEFSKKEKSLTEALEALSSSRA